MPQRHFILAIAAVGGLAALIASPPAQAGAQINGAQQNALSSNSLSTNSLSVNSLTINALTSNDAAFSGAELGQLNGVAVVGIILPEAAAP